MTMRYVMLILACLLLQFGAVQPAQAATRAELDRDRVALGESVTLTIETDQMTAMPDFSPLSNDFHLSGQRSSRQMGLSSGRLSASTSHEVTLSPKRAGLLTVPSLRVGRERTVALPLTVSAAAAPAARGNASAFLETELDDPDPYVQQSVGVIVRLYYSVPLASGQLDLDTPEGASLQRIGEDVQSNREINGRRYNVVERRFLMIPERSGPLTLPGPRFVGRGVGGWMDDFLGGDSRELSARGTPRQLQVRPQPASAPQPWLPLRNLRLRYVEAPRQARAGEAVSVVVEAVAEGATQAQMPELPVPSLSGAQVFPEPVQHEESFVDGSPRVKLTQRFSVVPGAAGTLQVPGPVLAWWDVRAGKARVSELPGLTMQVQPGSGSFAAPAAPVAGPAGSGQASEVETGLTVDQPSASRLWPWLAVAFALLWLLTLAWALLRRSPALIEGVRRDQATPRAGPSHTLVDLRRALDRGDLDEVGEVLRGMATPPVPDLDALQAALGEPAQRNAVEQLRRARWAGGDGGAARSALRAAFSKGPVWQHAGVTEVEVLTPLYPER